MSTGFSDDIGSWKIIEMSLPRNLRSSSSFSASTSRPSKVMLPATILPGSGTSRRMERAVIDFPDPDSPTMPTVSPRLTRKSMPSTARTIPPRTMNWVLRPLTSRIAGIYRFSLGSSASRRPSPMKFTAISVTRSATEGTIMVW